MDDTAERICLPRLPAFKESTFCVDQADTDTVEYIRADLHHKALDRIEELQSRLRWVITERDDTFVRMLRRVETAEAKLAKALEALGAFADDTNWFDAAEEDGTFYPAWRGTGSPEEIARVAIAKAKGEER